MSVMEPYQRTATCYSLTHPVISHPMVTTLTQIVLKPY